MTTINEKHAEILERFKTEVCSKSKEIDPGDEYDWYDLSVGYFLAKGLTIADATNLAVEARYQQHYWQ